jgi:hypothetical protein
MVTLQIPAEPSLFRTTDLPAEEIRLPMTLDAAAWLPWAGVALGVFGPIFLLAGWLLLGSPPNVGFGTKVMLASFGVVFAAVGLCSIGAALTAFTDAHRRGSLLVLSDASLWDRRSIAAPLAWADIGYAKVEYTRGGVAGVRLKLRRTVEACHNPFRLGTLGFSWWRRPDELHVSVMGLRQKPRIIALVIVEMVLRNGGSADTRHPYSGVAL